MYSPLLTDHNNFSHYYSIGGLIIRVNSDAPINDKTFDRSIQKFSVPNIREDADLVEINHRFSLPPINYNELGTAIYSKTPWTVYRSEDKWIYIGYSIKSGEFVVDQIAIFNSGHSICNIFHSDIANFRQGHNNSLSLLTTDQIILARLLADKNAAIFHSAGMIIDDQGFLFIGHSGAGKSTLTKMLRDQGEILCDDRNIVRRLQEGWRIYGTWSHGDIPKVSPASASLRAILLLEQASENKLIPLNDRREIVRRLPFFIIKPLITADWWEKTLNLVGAIAREVPVYRLQFDRSGQVIDVLRTLL